MSEKIFNVSVLSIFSTKRKGKHKFQFTVTTNSVDTISLTYIEFKFGWRLQKSKGLEPYSHDDSIKILDACHDFLDDKENPHVKKNPSVPNTSFTNSFQIIF